MLDRILDLLSEVWTFIVPFCIVDQYEEGVILRCGKFSHVVRPGIHFKIPLADKLFTETVVTTTLRSGNQSISTKDGHQIVVASIMKYRIVDVKIFLLEVTDAIDAMEDILAGKTRLIIKRLTYNECCEQDIDRLITQQVRNEAKRWGIKVDSVTLTDFGRLMSIRLLQDDVLSSVV